MKRGTWQAKWIGRPDVILWNSHRDVLPAPFFRRVLDCTKKMKSAKVCICGLGYYELYINGSKVGDHVLDPVVTHYDKRVRYVIYDVTSYLVCGKNVLGVVLGNGWYNCHTPDVWNFDKATWRDYPKFLLELEVNNKVILCSDDSWKISSGPIVFDGLRNGEFYDARLELDGWMNAGYDDSNWKKASKVSSPGGILQEQTMPPCKVMKTLPAQKQWSLTNGDIVYDFGQNITGWVRINCIGERGTELLIKYAERLEGDDITQENIAIFIKGGEFQTDKYILKGDGMEVWEPRFTYHGFQYIKISGNLESTQIGKVEGRVIYTAFDRIGDFSCSNQVLNQLQQCTLWSYIGNFTGIPTDCPHREKNGWTGDAQLAAETGLFNFASGTAYNQWMDSFADVQRPSGQLPGIVPSAGWGFNWGSGPAWDSAFLLIPWYIYLYTGDASVIKSHYDSMKKYVDYCTSMATDYLVSFGLGDWCHVDKEAIAPVELTSTAYYYVDSLLIAKFAGILGKTADRIKYSRLAAKIRESFNSHFYHGNGIYANGEPTALGCAIYQGLVADAEKNKVVEALALAVKKNNYKAYFGILGAKYIPRALSENGYVDIAYKLITQPDFPGWAYWLKEGATTLWGNWNGKASLNHIMFGDISAWMYQYLAGIIPDPKHPGFKHVTIKPHPVPDLKWVHSEYTAPAGKIVSEWKQAGGKFNLTVEIPPNTTGTIIMPNSKCYEVKSGKQSRRCNMGT